MRYRKKTQIGGVPTKFKDKHGRRFVLVLRDVIVLGQTTLQKWAKRQVIRDKRTHLPNKRRCVVRAIVHPPCTFTRDSLERLMLAQVTAEVRFTRIGALRRELAGIVVQRV